MPDFVVFVPTIILLVGAALALPADLLPYPAAKRWVAVGAVGISLAIVLSLARKALPLEATLFTWQIGYERLAPVVYGYYLDAISYGVLVISLFAALILVLYATHYVSIEPKRQLVLCSLVLITAAAFVNLLLAGNVLVAYVSLQIWIIASAASIAFWHHGGATTPAVVRSFLLASLPSTGVLVGAVALSGHGASLGFQLVSPGGASWILLLGFLLSATAISHLYPFHPWTAVKLRIPLPAAALLGLVFAPWAGAYLLQRSHSLAGPQTEVLVHQSLMAVGALTMVVGAVYTLKQTHLRGIAIFLASIQLGYAFLGFGINTPASVAAALLMLANSTFSTCGLMICAGIVERSTGTGSVIKLGRLVNRVPRTTLLFAVFSISLAGAPFPALGFFAKWLIFGAAVEAHHVAFAILTLVVDFLVFVTLLRAFDWVFFRRRYQGATGGGEGSRTLILCAGLLAVPVVAFGVVPFVLVGWLVKPATALVVHASAATVEIPLPTGLHSAGFTSSAFTFLLMVVPTLLGSIAYMFGGLGSGIGGQAPTLSLSQRAREGTGHRPLTPDRRPGWFPRVINTGGLHNAGWRALLGAGVALRKLLSPADTTYSPMAILLAALAVVLALLE
ncbi:MAG: hypothetical protein HYX94_04570 [Chloroflexi bacterium]|nr:hypothetical protein [Chloroflexota bacterium]